MKKLIKKLKHHLFLYKGSKNQETYIPERSKVNVTILASEHSVMETYKLVPVRYWESMFGIKWNLCHFT